MTRQPQFHCMCHVVIPRNEIYLHNKVYDLWYEFGKGKEAHVVVDPRRPACQCIYKDSEWSVKHHVTKRCLLPTRPALSALDAVSLYGLCPSRATHRLAESSSV